MTTVMLKNYCLLLGKEALTQYFTNNWVRVENYSETSVSFFLKMYLFLLWSVVSLHCHTWAFFLVAGESKGYSLLAVADFALWWLFLLQTQALGIWAGSSSVRA